MHYHCLTKSQLYFIINYYKMKKILLILSLFVSTLSFGQSFDVSLNLAPMVVNNYSGAFMYNLNDDMSVGSVIGYQNLKLGDFKFQSFYIAPEFRFYFDADENDGYYAAGYMKFRSASSNENYGFNENGDYVEYEITNTGLAVGANFGRVWSTRSGFFFNPWSGLGLFVFDKQKYSNDYVPSDEETTNLSNFEFRLGLSLGWRF